MERTINGITLDDFTFAYVTVALWAETDESNESGGEPLDKNYGPEDVAPSTLKELTEECAAFRAMEWTHTNPKAPEGRTRTTHTVNEWCALIERPAQYQDSQGNTWTTDEQDGHDFYLTRNGHGVGYWDRGYGPIGDILTDAAKSYGTSGLYVGDDGKIYTHG